MRSFGDIAGSTILGDVAMLGVGYTVVFAYVMVMLGGFNCVEQKAFLSVAGIVSVVMGIVLSSGEGGVSTTFKRLELRLMPIAIGCTIDVTPGEF